MSADPVPLAYAPAQDRSPARLTLALCTVLHAFTHAYGTMLVPLYLLMVADLKLAGVGAASLIVTVYGLVYCLGSYGAGVLADRIDRKVLLGIGLVGNAVAILGMGLTRDYELLIAWGVLAGIAGTFFHPAANALVTAHYPRNPGLAIGILGMGAGFGFFAGPQYAGWRADAGAWHLGNIADWQRPLVELGAAGLVVGILFLMFAREADRRRKRFVFPGVLGQLRARVVPDAVEPTEPAAEHPPLGRGMRWRVSAVAATLAFRDFAGIAGLPLASIYLQKAHGRTAAEAGFIVGTMMLLSVLVNPLAVYVSPGRRRLPLLALVLITSGCIVAAVPYVPLAYTLLVLCAFQTCQLSSYAISDAAILERVAPHVRGRVVGLFLTIAGTFASTGPWAMGFWTDALGSRAGDPRAYVPIFGTLGMMMAFAAVSTRFIAALGEPRLHAEISPISEVMPEMVERVG